LLFVLPLLSDLTFGPAGTTLAGFFSLWKFFDERR